MESITKNNLHIHLTLNKHFVIYNKEINFEEVVINKKLNYIHKNTNHIQYVIIMGLRNLITTKKNL